MDFALTTIAGCAFSAPFARSGKRKLALHAPARPQAPFRGCEDANGNNGSGRRNSVDAGSSSLPSSAAVHGKKDRGADSGILHGAVDNDDDVARVVLNPRDSLLVYLEQAASALSFQKGKLLDGEDDDTATTVSFCSASSSLVEKPRVSFAKPLVTEVRRRPRTTRAEKYFLHYDEHDYADFKREFVTGRGRNRKVSFKCEDSTVHQLPPPGASKEDLFYSERDLRGFLDDFVQSLNHH